MHRVWSACFLALAVLNVAAGAYASLASGGPRMGPTTTIKRPAFHGYYDGHKDLPEHRRLQQGRGEGDARQLCAGAQVGAAEDGAGDLSRAGQSRCRTAGRLRLGARRGELLAGLEGDDPDLEGERVTGLDQERHAGRPAREEGDADRASDLDPTQLPDHQSGEGRVAVRAGRAR